LEKQLGVLGKNYRPDKTITVNIIVGPSCQSKLGYFRKTPFKVLSATQNWFNKSIFFKILQLADWEATAIYNDLL
jgi:hypothetical protein